MDLKIEGISYTYSRGSSGEPALIDLSLLARGSQMTAILGPNGSGKSTAFRLISNDLELQKGSISFVNETEVVPVLRSQVSAYRKSLGICFQSPSLDPYLTVEENLKVAAALYSLSSWDSHRAISRLLRDFDLIEKRKTLVKKLSGGLARRVELAKALLHEPKILLLDEPTTGLDPKARHDFWSQIHLLKKQGTAILLITHFLEEAEECDYLYFLNRGKIVGHGSPEDLKKKFGSEIVRVRGKTLSSVGKKILQDLEGQCKDFRWNQEEELLIETSQPSLVLDYFNREWGRQLTHLEWTKPTLSDVYFKLTGVSF